MAVDHVLTQIPSLQARALSFHDFLELCERARDGLILSAPIVSTIAQNAKRLLADLHERHPALGDGDLSDTLVMAAAMLSTREYARHGLALHASGDRLFGARATMFAQAAREEISRTPPATSDDE